MLAARHDESVASATFLTTMLDFADPGEIGVYIAPESLAAREPALMAGQRVHGSELAGAFASLRPNDLVWNYVVNNYLKGRTPPPFDLLYWNGDSANLPGPMYSYYLQNMYVGNKLREHAALTMLGAPIDLARIKLPAYVFASRDDHIVPWRSAYRTPALLGGTSTFVLGASGHIAGVVNPPAGRQAQLLDERRARRERRRLDRACDESCGQLVAALVSVARRACGRPARSAIDLRQHRIPAARAGAGSLRRGSGRLRRRPRAAHPTYSPGIFTTLISIAEK